MKRLAYLTLALAAILINGCSNEGLESAKLKVDESKKSLEFIILEDEALEAATDFLNGGNVEARSASNAEVKTIWRHITLSDDVSSRSATENETVEVPVYVVSYSDENGNPDGYVVTVGDKRVINRVLVFSEDGNWDLSGVPGFESIFWDGVDNSLTQTLLTSNVDPCDTYEYEDVENIDFYAVNSLLEWGQSPAPYNDSLPACNATSNKLAGCVAVAMGQLMAHHEYPSSGSYTHKRYNRLVNATYDWTKMKATPKAENLTTTEGRSGVANLMAEIGEKVNMSYGCTSSSAEADTIEAAFNNLGYRCIMDTVYNWETIMDEIDADRPVLVGGEKEGGGGHIWVVEGYRHAIKHLVYGRDCPDGSGESIPPTIIESSLPVYYLYFNVGWHGSNNGFYSTDITQLKNYKKDVKMYVGITPLN